LCSHEIDLADLHFLRSYSKYLTTRRRQYDKTDAELEASSKADVDKWMAGIKKAPPPKKFVTELEAERKMLRCLARPKKPMHSDYKRTMQNPHCAKNQDEYMLKFLQEIGLLVEQLHGQSEIQMAHVPKA
jgi:hypothetical protein